MRSTLCLSLLGMALIGCAVKSKSSSSSNNNNLDAKPTLGYSVTDRNGVSVTTAVNAPSSGSLVQPLPELGDKTPWEIFSQVATSQNITLQSGDIRAALRSGLYSLYLSPSNSGATYQYDIHLPNGLAMTSSGLGCASQMRGQFTGSLRICVDIAVPTAVTLLPIEVSISNADAELEARLMLLAIPPLSSANYALEIVSATAMPQIAPVKTRQAIFRTLNNTKSSIAVTPSTFDINVVRAGLAVNSNSSITLEPAAAGSVQSLGNGRYRVSVTQGGPLKINAVGVDGSVNYTVALNAAIPRELLASWTHNESDPAVSNRSQLKVSCRSEVNSALQVRVKSSTTDELISIPTPYVTHASMLLGSAMDDLLEMNSGKATLSLDGNVPFGKVSCSGIAQRIGGKGGGYATTNQLSASGW